MMLIILKSKVYFTPFRNLRFLTGFSLFLIILLSQTTLFSQTIGQNPSRNKATRWTRIAISTSGPAKFNSYWLTWPPRLVIEFQSKNVVGKIDNEIVINQGMLKKITSSYFEKEQNKSLKSLTFEFTRKAPYKIWQEDNKILLDIRAPLKISGFPEEDNEILVRSETGAVIIKKLEAMEKALTQVAESQPKAEIGKVEPEIPLVERGVLPVPKPVKMGENMMGILFWLMGLVLASGIGFLIWLFWRRYRLILDKNLATQELIRVKAELEKKNKLLEQEEILRKTIENTSILREKEFEQLKLELENQKGLLGQERSIREKIEEELLQKQRECEQVKDSLESLKGVLVEKGFAKRLSSPEEKEGLWIPEKSTERRDFPRLDLSRDYNRTIIIRIEPPDGSKGIKTFVNNISSGGLCFEARKEFTQNDRINLRLFFFGDKVPMIKIQAQIVWKKIVPPVNFYGLSFISLKEKDKAELNRYIEAKIERSWKWKDIV